MGVTEPPCFKGWLLTLPSLARRGPRPLGQAKGLMLRTATGLEGGETQSDHPFSHPLGKGMGEDLGMGSYMGKGMGLHKFSDMGMTLETDPSLPGTGLGMALETAPSVSEMGMSRTWETTLLVSGLCTAQDSGADKGMGINMDSGSGMTLEVALLTTSRSMALEVALLMFSISMPLEVISLTSGRNMASVVTMLTYDRSKTLLTGPSVSGSGMSADCSIDAPVIENFFGGSDATSWLREAFIWSRGLH